MENQTYSNCSEEQGKVIDMDDLKKIAYKTQIGSVVASKKKRWFERLMNHFGWYRSSEWYIIDTQKLIRPFSWPPKV